MTKRDYYEVLGLHPECTQHDIKQNFKRLALKWHPDKCYDKTEAQLRFSEINEAYTILTDVRTKQIYDVHGHKGIEIDQENGNQGVPTTNFFFQKGFQGSQKSAFDVLQDIFKERDDDNDDFFSQKNDFGVSETLKATIHSFMEDDGFSKQAEIGLSFFDTYKPTFMNPEFFLPPPEFDNNIADKSYTAQIFSFFASSSEDQMYATTSTTVIQNGKETSTQMTFINDNGLFNDLESVGDKENKKGENSTNNKCYEQFYTQISREPSVMIINDNDDSDDNVTSSPNKDIKLGIRRSSDEIIEELNAKLRDSVCLKSKKISKDKNSLNIRLMNKKPSKKNRS